MDHWLANAELMKPQLEFPGNDRRVEGLIEALQQVREDAYVRLPESSRYRQDEIRRQEAAAAAAEREEKRENEDGWLKETWKQSPDRIKTFKRSAIIGGFFLVLVPVAYADELESYGELFSMGLFGALFYGTVAFFALKRWWTHQRKKEYRAG